MLALTFALLAALATLLLPAAALAAPGDADTAYGTEGRATTFFGDRSTDASTVLFPGGDRTIVVGSATGIAVARYDATGALDSGFGTGGKIESAFPGGGTPSIGSAALWPTAAHGTRLVVGGTVGDLYTRDFALAVYDAAGQPDESFSTDGFARTPLRDKVYATAGAVVPDGEKLLVVGDYYDDVAKAYGIAIARYNTDGTPDAGFGTSGVRLIELGANELGVRAAGLQSNGDLVVAGQHTTPADRVTSLLLLRFTKLSDYAGPDTTFLGGARSTLLGEDSARATELLVGPGDKLTVSGSVSPTGQAPHMLAARFSADGVLDDTFGTGGKTMVSFGTTFAYANTIARDAQGRHLIGGELVGGTLSLGFARLTADGVLDSSFGSGGRVSGSYGASGATRVQGIGTHSGDKIVVAGDVRNDSGRAGFTAVRFAGGDAASAAPPSVAVTAPVPQQWFNAAAPPTFSGTRSTRAGDHSLVTVNVFRAGEAAPLQSLAATADAGDTWSAAPSAALPDGSYEVEAVQTSESSGTGTSGKVPFRVDTVRPAPAVGVPTANQAFAAGEPLLSGTLGMQGADAGHSADQAEALVRLSRVSNGTSTTCDSAPTATCTWHGATVSGSAWTAPEVLRDRPDGTWDVWVEQRDVAGNTGKSSPVRFKLDRTAPQPTIADLPRDGYTSDTTPSFSGARGTDAEDEDSTADEPVAVRVVEHGADATLQTLAVEQSGAAWAATVGTALPAGRYDVVVTQRDVAGNATTQRRPFVVDLSGPAVTADDPADGAHLNKLSALAGSRAKLARDGAHAADADQVIVRLFRGSELVQTWGDAGSGATWSVTPPALPDGGYSWDAEQADEVGNVTTTKRRSFTLDTRAPRVTIESPTSGQDVPAGEMTVSGRATPGDGDVSVRVNAPLYERNMTASVGSDGRWSAKTTLGGFTRGDHSVVAWQTDKAGNKGESARVPFVVPPTSGIGPQPAKPNPLQGAKPAATSGQYKAIFIPEQGVANDNAVKAVKSGNIFVDLWNSIAPPPLRISVDVTPKTEVKGGLSGYPNGNGAPPSPDLGAGALAKSNTKGLIAPGGNAVAAGGGNVVAAGGGNVVAAGGGNVVAAGGGNVVAAGGGNVVAAGGGNILNQNNAGILSSASPVVAVGGDNIARAASRRPTARAAAAKRPVVFAYGAKTAKKKGRLKLDIKWTPAGRKMLAAYRKRAKALRARRKKVAPLELSFTTVIYPGGKGPGVFATRVVKIPAPKK